MRGQGKAWNRPGARALALLLTLAVGFGVTGLARTGQSHKHAVRVAAVLAVSSVDVQHGSFDVDRNAAPTRLPAASVVDTTRNSSSFVSSRTALAPQVRGPPGQGLV